MITITRYGSFFKSPVCKLLQTPWRLVVNDLPQEQLQMLQLLQKEVTQKPPQTKMTQLCHNTPNTTPLWITWYFVEDKTKNCLNKGIATAQQGKLVHGQFHSQQDLDLMSQCIDLLVALGALIANQQAHDVVLQHLEKAARIMPMPAIICNKCKS